MKVLFLDIDGVLNKEGTKEKVKLLFGEFTGVDQKLFSLFDTWLEDRPDLYIVLSSSWRTEQAAIDHLQDLGLKFLDKTPYLPGCDRGLEIFKWLFDHPEVTAFAVLDDVNNMGPVVKRLVQTSCVHGLRDKDLKKLDKLLGYEKTSE